MTLRNSGGLGCGWVAVPFLSVWLLLWSAGTLVFDVGMAHAVWQQARTRGFATTDGTVLHSEVDVEHDEGTTYSVRVRYRYEVNGQKFESSQFRYFQASGSQRWTHATVAAMPVNKTVTVYYDPARPSEAVLMPGLALCDLLPTIFLIPFNLVMIGGWAAVYYTLRACGPFGSGQPNDLPAGVQVINGQHGDVVRLPGVSPVLAAGCASGAAAFVLIFVLGFGFEMHGPLWPAFVAWAIILGAGLAAARWAVRDQQSGQYDLLLNDSRRLVALPKRRDDFESPAWKSIDELRQTAVFERVTKDSDGDDVKRYVTQFVTREGGRLDIHEWTSESDAQQVAVWLAQRLRLKSPG